MFLSFVGSSKCYTIINFVTVTLYQYDTSMSTYFTDFQPTLSDSLQSFFTNPVIYHLYF